MNENKQFKLEHDAKIAFEKLYSTEYLEHLSQKSTTKLDLVEFAWTAFLHGYIQGQPK